MIEVYSTLWYCSLFDCENWFSYVFIFPISMWRSNYKLTRTFCGIQAPLPMATSSLPKSFECFVKSTINDSLFRKLFLWDNICSRGARSIGISSKGLAPTRLHFDWDAAWCALRLYLLRKWYLQFQMLQEGSLRITRNASVNFPDVHDVH